MKPYNQVITSGAVTDSGVFIVHRISDKLLPRAADRTTRAHIVDLQARIDQILNPR